MTMFLSKCKFTVAMKLHLVTHFRFVFFLFFFLNDDLFFLRHDDLLRRRDVLDNFRRYVDVRARGAQRPCKQQLQTFNI